MRIVTRLACFLSRGALFLGLAATASPAAALTLIGTYDSPGTANDVAIVGDVAYVADGAAGLRIADVSNPAAPVPLGFSAAAANATEIVVANGVAYVKDGTSGVRVIDVSTPATPALLTTIPLGTFNQLYHLALGADRLYVSQFSVGVRAWDVSTPGAPALLGTSTAVLSGGPIAVDGHLVHVSGGSGGGAIVDFSVPALPVALAPLTSSDDVALGPGRAYVAQHFGSGRIHMLDVTDPSAPRALHDILIGSTPPPLLEAAGRLLYAVAGNEIRILDASAAPAGVPIAEVDLTNVENGATGARRVVRVADLAYVSLGSQTQPGTGGALAIVDLASPDAPVLRGSVALPGEGWDLDVFGGRAYVALGGAGFAIVDVSDPDAPALLGSFDTSGCAWDVAVSGALALVADDDGVRVVDVSNPAAPSLAGQIGFAGKIVDVEIAGSLAYFADSLTNLARIVSFASPASPVQIGSAPGVGGVQHVAVGGPYLYALGNGGVKVLDVTNPASPVERFSSFAVAGERGRIVGQRLWTIGSYGVSEYNIANPIFPLYERQIGNVGTNRFDDAVVSAPRAFALSRNSSVGTTRLSALDLGNPGWYPYQVNALARPAAPTALRPVPSAGRLYSAEGADGVRIFDITTDLANRDCSDGVDDDADGLTDFPADPGCRDPYLTAVESPACNNGLDDDADTLVDLADPQCTSASVASESPPPPSGCGLLGVEPILAAGALRLVRTRRRI